MAAASREQSQGIEQVAKAVAEMDKVTQASAANAEEGASAAEELAAQAQSLRETVAQLQALANSRSAPAGMSSLGIAPGKSAPTESGADRPGSKRPPAKTNGDRTTGMPTGAAFWSAGRTVDVGAGRRLRA